MKDEIIGDESRLGVSPYTFPNSSSFLIISELSLAPLVGREVKIEEFLYFTVYYQPLRFPSPTADKGP